MLRIVADDETLRRNYSDKRVISDQHNTLEQMIRKPGHWAALRMDDELR